jgi:hypothetical protein
VVKFHKEIAARAESSFFSLNGRDSTAERWTSALGFEPTGLAGPWRIPVDALISTPFKLAVDQEVHEAVFLGGPCYLAWEKGMRGGWIPQWRPIFYREIKVTQYGNDYELSPDQGTWSLSPLVCSLIDRLQVSAGDDLDAFAKDVIESASAREDEGQVISEAIFDALIGRLPELEDALRKAPRADTFDNYPSKWVLFAPTSNFSALTRHLMADYTRLEALLEDDPSNIGGLEVLDDSAAIETEDCPPVLPVTRLNEAQERAVENILGNEALSVVSGPPGCGKSQVVVSALLNAWARGKSVLFASNNNSAVDVVRQRLERFESSFPIAVRAGNRQKNNVVELLRRTLNYASGSSATEEQQRASEDRRKKLLQARAELQRSLDGKLPQRAAEGLRTALNAYGEYQKLLEEIADQKRAIEESWAHKGFEGVSLQDAEHRVKAAAEWLSRADFYKEEQRKDARRLSELEQDLLRIQRKRQDVVGRVGLDPEDGGDWGWLVDGPSASLLDAWETDFQQLLTGEQEEALEPFEWFDEYGRWDSEADAIATRDRARLHAQDVRKRSAELSPRVVRISEHRSKLKKNADALSEVGLEEKPEIPIESLNAWSACYSEHISRRSSRLDFLPWSERSKLRRRMRKLEGVIRPFVPLSKWREIGALDAAGGRDGLSEVVERFRKWKEALDQWTDLAEERRLVEESFEAMRSESGVLGLRTIPQAEDQNEWQAVAEEADGLAKLADKAAEAIRKREARDRALSLISNVVRSWRSLASGQPIKEHWAKGLGARLVETLGELQANPSPGTLTEVRNAYYSGHLSELERCWSEAVQVQMEAIDKAAEIEAVPAPEDRIRAWDAERPGQCVLSTDAKDQWPDFETLNVELKAVEDLCSRMMQFRSEMLPDARRKAQNEHSWANEQLGEAIAILPPSNARTKLEQIHSSVQSDGSLEWPVDQISEAFREFSPEIISAKIDRIDAELEKGSFELSKAAWLKRLQEDEDAVEAVDQLEKAMRRNGGRITEEQFDLFRRSLRIVPIWITTAQAAQAIPLEPKLFDLVIIDEASQCTLTNLLPLLYRGKRLAIIGDSEQLPAIPTVQETEELTLARKFDVEPFLSMIGHATNDVYSVAADSLPRGRAGVLNLDEHFRSNPQIIGFSNRHIYQQRLVLKTDPSKGNSLPIGSGVHRIHVNGMTSRGDRGRSWKNLPEAQRVVDLVRKLRAHPQMHHFSIGVVTPFAAQKELIRGMMDGDNNASRILVDSAYGFQGDERDVIIFSPVVAAGITSSASRWVESPPNLINVALTRARQALFVVADFDYCLQQDGSGILRKLADYCNDIQTLRDTSPAELELFSWMIVQGWSPEIHPRLGDVEVDFTLSSPTGLRLAIEVDGAEYHDDQQTTDRSRDAFLQAQGWRVLRIPARAVLETPHNVIEKIKVLTSQSPTG